MKKILLVLLLVFGGLTLVSCNKDEDVIIVGLEADYAPFNFTTNKKSEFTHPLSGRVDYVDGYDVVIAKMIAEKLGKKLVIKAIEFEALIEALNSGAIDLIIAGMTDTPERATSVLFTDPYFEEEPVILLKKTSIYANRQTLNDFAGAKVVAQQGTIYVEYVEDLPGTIPQQNLETYALLAQALISGSADIVIAEKPVAIGMVEQNSDLTYINFAEGEGFLPVTVSIGLRLGSTELQEEINELLNSLTEERRKEIMDGAVERQ